MDDVARAQVCLAPASIWVSRVDGGRRHVAMERHNDCEPIKTPKTNTGLLFWQSDTSCGSKNVKEAQKSRINEPQEPQVPQVQLRLLMHRPHGSGLTLLSSLYL